MAVQAVPIQFALLPTGDFPASYFDEDFAYLIGQLNVILSGVGFQPVVSRDSVINVGATWNALVLQKAVPAPTTIHLPAVADRNGLGLVIADWNGNAGDISLVPFGVEKIMGLAGGTLVSNAQGLGAAASLRLWPSTALGGWYQG